MENNKESNNFIKYFEEESLTTDMEQRTNAVDPCLVTINSIVNHASNMKDDEKVFEKKSCEVVIPDSANNTNKEENLKLEILSLKNLLSNLKLKIVENKITHSLVLFVKTNFTRDGKSLPTTYISKFTNFDLKKKLTIAAVLAFVFAFSGNLTSLISNNSIKSAAAQLITGGDPVESLTNELNSAYQYALSHNNSFFGYTASNGVVAVAGTKELVLTLVTEGKCWSTGVAEGYPPKEIRYDPSGSRCQSGNLEQLKQIIK